LPAYKPALLDEANDYSAFSRIGRDVFKSRFRG
jgi:hypothetical protein